MPSNTHKSAAVPFINQKGERSMKRVKVERYVAGKKPAYAKDEDDEEEYYITEDEDEDEDVGSQEEEGEDDGDDDDYETDRAFRADRKLDYGRHESEDNHDDTDSDDEDPTKQNKEGTSSTGQFGMVEQREKQEEKSDTDDDDDPRFRKLKQIESKTNNLHPIDVQRTLQIQPKYELKNVVLDEDDDENEIRLRHAMAKSRQVEVALEKSRPALDAADELKQEDIDDDDSLDGSSRQKKRLETDDLLKDLKLTGISRPMREKLKTDEEAMEEKRRMKELIEQAKQEASFTRQTYEKINEDIKKEVEKEALAKGDIGAREMTTVNTDDDDDELAYEEWKLREIQRVLRDRSERRLATHVR